MTVKFDAQEFDIAINILRDYIMYRIDNDVENVLTTAKGSNFQILVIPSAESEYADMIAEKMNANIS